jgi:uncharacterized caspase-like protein
MRLPRLVAPLLVLLALAANADDMRTEPRVALVIGNALYKDSPLANPVNDARAFGRILRDAGFEVVEAHDATALQMRRAIRDFGERLRPNGVSLFYFAGHGVQMRGRSFLLPVDADVRNAEEVEENAVDVSRLLARMENAKPRVKLLILDACRNNPYASSSRTLTNGIAEMDAPTGTLIAFATSPGQVAADGKGANGLFTEHLIREMATPGLKVEDVFKRVRSGVRAASAGRQVPWENSSLESDFYFVLPDVVDAAALEQERKRQQDEAIQRAVREERRRLEQQYGERLAALEKAALRVANPTTPPPPASVAIPTAQPVALDAVRPINPMKPIDPARPVAEPRIRSEEPAEETKPEDVEEMPASFLIALGVDPANRNRVHPLPDDVARALVPSRPKSGDTWTYFREIRDGRVTRRNYLTTTAAFAGDDGYTLVHSDSTQPARHDASGNRLSAPQGSGQVTFDPAEILFRFPLVAGATWSGKTRERGASAASVETEVTVVGWEDLKVTAGSFKAVKIAQIQYRNDESFPGQGRSKRVSTFWYVPAVRNIARMEALEVNERGIAVYDQAWELDYFDLQL